MRRWNPVKSKSDLLWMTWKDENSIYQLFVTFSTIRETEEISLVDFLPGNMGFNSNVIYEN